MKKAIYLLLLILFCLPLLLSGQRGKTKKYRFLGRPAVLNQVVDYESANSLYRNNYQAIINESSTRSKGEDPWIVMSDRAGTEVFNKAGSSTSTDTLKFREGPFYVVDEEGDYIELATGTASRGRLEGSSRGWVRKKDMLLWMRSITGRSKIPRFVFILYKANAASTIFKSGSNKALVYQHPTDTTAKDTIQIFEFYSVLKQEGNRYLLANDVSLTNLPSQRTFEQRVIGWVDASNCTEWNTRVVLEPNFTETAVSDRKSNKNNKVIGYQTAGQAGTHARTGTAMPNNAIWNNDPIGLEASVMAETNTARFKGNVMRFPLLSGTTSDADFFKSGVIGEVKLDGKEINVTRLSQFCSVLDKKATAKNKVNVLYVVQGTYNMKAYKDDIVSSLAEVTQSFAGMNANIRYGGVVYHNITDEAAVDGLLKIHNLSSNRASLETFLETTVFDNFDSEKNSNYPVPTYALEQGLLKARFNQEETNIVILIGSDGDFQYDRSLRSKFASHPAAVPSSRLIEDMSYNEVQLYSFCTELKTRSNNDFLDFSKGLISRSAVKVYNSRLKDAPEEYRKEVEVKKQEPSFPTIPDNPAKPGEVMITRSAIPGGIYFPAAGRQLTNLGALVLKSGGKSRSNISTIQRIVDDFCIKGNSWKAISRKGSEAYENEASGDFGSIILKVLNDATANINIPAEYLGKRYQLYNEVYFPRQIKGADDPVMSYVLFIKDNDVALYLNTVENILNGASGAADDRREAVVDIYATLLRHFTGNEALTNKKLGAYSINSINRIMFGLEDEGVAFGRCNTSGNFNVRGIMDRRVVKDEEINKIISGFEQVTGYLRKEVLSRDFDFVYTTRSGEKYFWLPLEKMYSCGE